jgi:hypothetical protein
MGWPDRIHSYTNPFYTSWDGGSNCSEHMISSGYLYFISHVCPIGGTNNAKHAESHEIEKPGVQKQCYWVLLSSSYSAFQKFIPQETYIPSLIGQVLGWLFSKNWIKKCHPNTSNLATKHCFMKIPSKMKECSWCSPQFCVRASWECFAPLIWVPRPSPVT